MDFEAEWGHCQKRPVPGMRGTGIWRFRLGDPHYPRSRVGLVIGAAIDGMQMPPANLAMPADGLLHSFSLILGQRTWRLPHFAARFVPAGEIRRLFSLLFLDPPPLVAREPGSVGGPRQ